MLYLKNHKSKIFPKKFKEEFAKYVYLFFETTSKK